MSARGEHQVEFLKSVVAKGGRIVGANFVLPRGLSSGVTLYQLTLEQAGARTLQELPWTPELERYLLLERPTPMSSREEEVDRLANVLMNNLKSAESVWGEGYAQGVFVELLKNRPEYDLDRWIERSPTYAPSHDSDAYSKCRSFLEDAISGLQNTVVLGLKYPNSEETVRLISDALAVVLDERFHITVRNRLFPRGSRP